VSGPLVSVALATYNGEQHLADQLDSIWSQTWTALEVVVSDDLSSDGTVAILEEHAARHPLRYSVAPGRLGLVRNFERAITLCRGDLVTLCDQDDLWRPERIERLVAGLAAGHSLTYCKPREYLDEGSVLQVDWGHAAVLDWARRCGTGRVTERLLAENWVVSHGMLFRRDVVERALPIPDHQPYHDAWIALAASTVGEGIRFVDESLMIYRRHPASYTYAAGRPGRPARSGGLPGVLRGRFGSAWRSRCRAEIERIEDSFALPLDDAARACARDLVRFYRSGLSGRIDPTACRIGWRLAPLFASQSRPADRVRLALKGLAGGRLAARGSQASPKTDPVHPA